MGLKGYRLWAMGQLDSTCRAPPLLLLLLELVQHVLIVAPLEVGHRLGPKGKERTHLPATHTHNLNRGHHPYAQTTLTHTAPIKQTRK
jgi:hypothetical protein